MGERDLIVRCPGCGNGTVISMAVGQLLRCDVCRTAFNAPITADGQSDPAIWTDAFAVGQPVAPQEPTSTPGTAGSLRDGQNDLGKTRSWHADGMGGHDEQDIAAAKLVPDQSNSSPAANSDELEIPETSGLLWTIVTTCAVGVIATTILVAVLLVFQTNPGTEGDQAGLVPLPHGDTSASSSLRWTDASRLSQRKGTMTLKVERAFYGSMRAKDLNNEVIVTEDDNLLGITISVHNLGSKARVFQNWYGHSFKAVGSEATIAELTDDLGQIYLLLKFDDVTLVEGQRLAARIEPQEMVQDTVVFLIPREIDRSTIDYFRLSLPAAAVGMSGCFRFQVPASMIDGFATPQADAPNGP